MSGSGMATHPSIRLLRLVLVVLPLGCGLAGCESMDKYNPFAEHKTPLPGERKTIFSNGVPGVDFNAPPQQPSNSNVQIQTMSASQGLNQPGAASAAQSESSAAKQPAAKSASKSAPKSASQSAPKPASKSAAKPDSDDPWAGQR